MPIDTKLRSQLEEMDQKYGGDEMYRMLGSTLLSYTTTDSARMYMFTSHVKQVLTLLEPDVPHLQTGFENTIGKYSNAFKQLGATWEVKDVIQKFPELPDSGIFTVVLYNKKSDTYDMIESPVAENLTEKFGFIYNLDKMRTLKAGDKLKDEVLYKSTSFDEHMNYRYGKNATVYYSTSTDTLEDAIVVRKGWADSVRSVEIDVVQVSINTNEVLLNLYGDDSEYKTFPTIGERVKNSMICAVRQVNNEHLLYDFQKRNMQETNDTDAEYFVSKGAEIYDIDIYYNGDKEFPNSIFYQQLHGYYNDDCEYAKKMIRWCNEIKSSGSSYTENVSFYRSKYLHYNDKEYRWKNKDRAFANMVIEFKVKAIVPLEYGSKLTGRYGNKGVISGIADDANQSDDLQLTIGNMLADSDMSAEEIFKLTSNIQVVDDSRMPYMEDGPIDILLNASGAIRRLNPGQLCEVEANFIGEELRKRIKASKSIKEKEELIFKFLDIINKDESTFFRNMYARYDEEVLIDNVQFRFLASDSRDAFISDVEKNGFYLVRPPHKPLLYQDIMNLYEAFPDIKPVPLYIDAFGIKHRRIIKNGVCGSEYIIVLKQNSNKNFSARSTFRVNRSNLPAKDITKKTNRSSYARTPVRLSEIYNLMASISGETLAEYNIFTRSSPIGGKSLDRILSASENPLKIHKLKIRDNYTNSNADILNARLKSIGLGIEFSTAKNDLSKYPPDTVVPLKFYSYTIYDTVDKYQMYSDLFDLYQAYMKKYMIVEAYLGQKSDLCWDGVFNNKDLMKKYPLTEDQKILLKSTTKGSLLRFMQNLNEAPKTTINADGAEVPVKKKRGRKPKQRPIEVVAEVLEENRLAEEEDAEEYEPSTLIDTDHMED